MKSHDSFGCNVSPARGKKEGGIAQINKAGKKNWGHPTRPTLKTPIPYIHCFTG